VIWWAKVLKDDPLRVLRALRFSAKLSFRLHDSFWFAVPFALHPLQGKVAGARKVTELLKIAKAGRSALLDFLELSFSHPFPSPNLPMPCLAPALFGGADHNGAARFLSIPRGYDSSLMRKAIVSMPLELSEEESLGTALAAAVFACRHEWPAERSAREAREGTVWCEEARVDEMAADAAGQAQRELTIACDGLCASNELRAAAETPLSCVRRILTPPELLGQHAIFARASGVDGVDAAEFAALVHMWDVLKLDKALQGKRTVGCIPHFILELASTRCSPQTSAQLQARLARIFVEGPPVSGRALTDIPMLPHHLRAVMISHLHVLLRLRGETTPLEHPKQVVGFLGDRCGVLESLQDEWYMDGPDAKRVLRPEYAPPRKGKKGKN
ncbi:MAG: hypothetical protein SGPRY_001682, partial [Prymnesium sp.]